MFRVDREPSPTCAPPHSCRSATVGSIRLARHAGLAPSTLSHSTSLRELLRFVPLLLEAASFTLLYALIPNCAVRWREALVGGVVAAVLVELLKVGFVLYIAYFSSYRAVYGALAGEDSDKPQGLTARNRMAAILAAQGRTADAGKLVDEVLQRSARDNEALALRAELALVRGDSSAAITDLRTVIRDQPQAGGVRRELARAYVANGNTSLAEQSLRDGIDLDPHDVATRMALAQLLMQSNRAADAVSLLEPVAGSATACGQLDTAK